MWMILPFLGFFLVIPLDWERPRYLRLPTKKEQERFAREMAGCIRRTEKRAKRAAYHAEREARYEAWRARSRARLSGWLRLR